MLENPGGALRRSHFDEARKGQKGAAQIVKRMVGNAKRQRINVKVADLGYKKLTATNAAKNQRSGPQKELRFSSVDGGGGGAQRLVQK